MALRSSTRRPTSGSAFARALQALGVVTLTASPVIIALALLQPFQASRFLWAGLGAAGALVGGLGLLVTGWGVSSSLVMERALARTRDDVDAYASLLGSVPDAVIIANAHGRIVMWNPAASRMFGYTARDALGMNVERLVPSELRPRHLAGMSRFRLTGHGRFVDSHETMRLPALRSDGQEILVELTLSPLRGADSNGSEPHALAIVRDVTLRERSRARVDRLERQQRLILASVSEGIYGLDLEGRTTFVNAAAARMVGYAPHELVGRPMHAVLHHSHEDGTPYAREACPILRTLQDGSTQRVDRDTFWRRGGHAFPVRYVSAPVWEGDELTGAVVTFEPLQSGVEQDAASFAARAGEPPRGSP